MPDHVAKPSELELQVLSVLWDRGPSTARQVLELIPDRKTRAYTTVLTVLQVMEKKGLLTHSQQGTAHVYRPTVSRRQVVRPLLRGLVQRVFGGSPAAAVQHLLDESQLSAEELKKIRELLKDAERAKRESPKGG